MEGNGFRSPDLCWTVARRRLGEELLFLIAGWAEMLATGGRSLQWPSRDREYHSYRCAVRRLQRAGLLAYRRTKGRDPVLRLLPEGRMRIPDELQPEKRWNEKWDGTWYVLAYDVPEKQKVYRDALRRFLKRNRMGGLQGSVWVSPRDIRPVYADLSEAAGVGSYAVLLQAHTVLGQQAQDVVRQAWDIDAIAAAQERYRTTTEAERERLHEGALSRVDLLSLARDELSAFLAVMADDPLLPSVLWPPEYRGPETVAAHRRFQRAIARLI
jgi:phenylacetic acid degradation operon negative regulatory protein